LTAKARPNSFQETTNLIVRMSSKEFKPVEEELEL
jgi:hypothetical protein